MTKKSHLDVNSSGADGRAESDSREMHELQVESRRCIGYFLGAYPDFYLTFITREVVALRKLGLDIRTCSLRHPANGQVRTQVERDEQEKTFYIQKQGALKIMVDQIHFCVKSPWRYLSTLLYAVRVSPGGLYWKTRYLIYFFEAVTLALWAKKNSMEYLHVHIADAQCSVAMLAKKLAGLRYSVTANGPAIFDNVSELRLSEKFTNAERVVCISDFCKSQVMRWVRPDIWGQLVVVRHGIDPDIFAPPRGEKTTSKKVSLLCVAGLWPKKGHHILLAACRLLEERGLEFECVLVGDGEERKSLEYSAVELGIASRIEFIGAIDEEYIYSFYDNADIFVSSSLAEGIPNVLMEAMAKEIPVVAPNIMGIPELVDNEVHGILVPPANAVSLADGIERLARNPELRKRMGTEGRKRVIERFNLWTNASVLAKNMQELSRREDYCQKIPNETDLSRGDYDVQRGEGKR